MRLCWFFLVALSLAAGPAEFGRSEFQKAVRDLGLPEISLKESIEPGAPESYAITGSRITAADPRGLLYGLLTAAEQIRADGPITSAGGSPKTEIRGIRY